MDVWNAFGVKLSDVIEMPVLCKNEYHAFGNVLYQEPSDKYDGFEEMGTLVPWSPAEKVGQARHFLLPWIIFKKI
jgi:hypothetical protein